MSRSAGLAIALLLAIAARAMAETAVKHWAFTPVQPFADPAVKAQTWVRTPIDAFILSTLEQRNLAPAKPADKRTLVRRAYYDLWGLPPSFEEVIAFENDTSPDAFDKVIDRLLASPHYGERWGRYWLDLARYADTKGYVYSDREDPRFVHAHNYRDWVVRALNDDMPYDQFLLNQIAADCLMPHDGQPTTDNGQSNLAALGFLTVGRRFLGVAHDIIDDRIDVVTRTTQGLSVGCARCHDHKYDPIPTRDYYSLYGVFAGCTEKLVPLQGDPKKKSPEYQAYEAELGKRTQALDDAFAKRCDEVADRVRARSVEYLQAVPSVERLPDELFYSFRDGNDVYPVIVRQWQQYLFARAKGWSRVWGPWHELSQIPAGQFASEAPSVIRRIGDERLRWTNRRVAAALAAANVQSMADVAAVYGKLLLDADRDWKSQVKAKSPEAYLPDGDAEELRQVLYADDSPARVPRGSIADQEFYFDEGTRVQLAKLQMDIEKWLIDAPAAAPYAMILEDRAVQPDNPRVFKRGNPATKGEEVPRQYLEIIAGPDRTPFQHGSGRLEMAQAIASKSNSLTARVMVNRIWLGHFGAGLVKTPSDFGVRAEPPSHPELLDYLAAQFVERGWSIKAMHRLIMRSSAYQQGGEADDKSLAADPENRLLTRFEPQRLDFEAMHDSLLVASGELDATLGGRPVEMFAPPYSNRRAIYGRVDRQFLPPVLRTFDFASPDIHSPQRPSTTVPQQTLFMMNSPFVIDRARALASRRDVAALSDPAARVDRLYQILYQRSPTAGERAAGVQYVSQAGDEPRPPKPPPLSTTWQYGYGEFDIATSRIKAFAKLPHFTGSAWQGGAGWPDAALGWAQITADGGHAGDDLRHAVVRRWVSPIDGQISIAGLITHAHSDGDGIIARVVSSRHGELATWRLHNRKAQAVIDPIDVRKGDTLDFVVSIDRSLNNNDFTWSPIIKSAEPKKEWNAKKEFAGPPSPPAPPLTAWDKYAQVLLLANEFVFID